MPSDSDRMQRAALRLARTGDRLSRRFARQLAGVLRGLERDILAIGVAPRSSTALLRAAESQALRAQITELLRQSGYDSLIQAATGDPFDTLAERAAAVSLIDRPSATLRLEALRQVHVLELLEERTRLGELLSRTAVRGMVGNSPRSELIADLAAVLDTTERHVATMYDTTLSIYGREVEALQADPSPRTRFVYLGPADGSTRPFCLRYVGRVLERREINQLDNGQIGNPFITGGGWNCRHTWTEISAASDLQVLHKSKGRIPEVVEDVRRQRTRKRAA